MAETTSPTDTIYRPLSGFAIASFALGVFFAALIVISALVAVFQGSPIFFPTWFLILPMLSIVLGFFAQHQIANSEGTRAGAALAKYGIYASVFSGLGYFVYFFMTGMALSAQTHEFLMTKSEDGGFIPLLLNSTKDPIDFNRAFLLTLPAAQRAGARPEREQDFKNRFDNSPDGAPTAFLGFREAHLVKAILYAGKDAVIEPLGVQEWKYENKSYSVVRNVQIKTPEMQIEMQLKLQSSEGEEAGQGRKWFLSLDQTYPVKVVKTSFGEALANLRGYSARAMESKIRDWNKGAVVPYDPKTVPWDTFSMTKTQIETVKARLDAVLNGTEKDRLGISVDNSDMTEWEKLPDGRLRFMHPAKLPISSLFTGPPVQFMVEVRMASESKEPIDVKASAESAYWEFKSFHIVRAHAAQKMKK